MKTNLRVEYFRDGDHWGFRIPALNIVGTADTRDLAEREAVGTTVFVLEGIECEFDDDVEEVGCIEVNVKPGWPPSAGKPELRAPTP